MNSEYDCGICMESYDKYVRIPRVLACGHSFCESCLIELRSDCSSIVCPNCRTLTKHINEIKKDLPINCRLEKFIECRSSRSQDSESKFSHDNLYQSAIYLKKEIICLIEASDDYASYLKMVSGSNDFVYDKLRRNYEEEYDKIEAFYSTLVELLKQYKNKMQESILKNMLHQHQKIIQQNKEIQLKLAQLKEIKKSLKKINSETDIICHDEQSVEVVAIQSLKESFFSLTGRFEEELKFYPISKIELSQTETNLNIGNDLLKSFYLTDNLVVPVNQQKELTIEGWKFNDKLQSIKRPTIFFFSILPGNQCQMIKYDLISSTFSCKKLGVPYEMDLQHCELVSHPNSSSVFLIGPLFNFLYDNTNELFLKKPFFGQNLNVTKFVLSLLESHIYFIGGSKEFKALNICSRYNILSEKWSTLGNLWIERFNASACPINDYQLCVLGGENQESLCLDSIEILNVADLQWTLLEMRLSLPVKGANIISTQKDRIFIFGGESHGVILNQAHELDFLKKNFIELTDSAYARRKGKIFHINNYIYVFGGVTKKGYASLAERYSISENKWSCISDENLEHDEYFAFVNRSPGGIIFE